MFESFQDILNVDDLCEALGIGKNTAYSLLSSGQLKAFRHNRVWKIPKIAVVEYIYSKSGFSSNHPIR